MKWPKSLVIELSSRRCIIFLGAGASASCNSTTGPTKRPPTWSAFLEALINLMDSKREEPIIRKYLKKEKYLEAAEIIKKNIPSADFANFIRDELAIPNYGQSKIHEGVLTIDPKIVVTTNYDEIYDNYCRATAAGGYNVSKYYENHVTRDLKTSVRLIIKAHGCVSDSAKIVLTKSEYFRAYQENLNFYKVLDALFLTHTILFIGYGLNDPDIHLVLENVNITAPGSHPHYFITGNDLNKTIKETFKKMYNIEFIEYKAGDYNELEQGIQDLSEEVIDYRTSNPSV